MSTEAVANRLVELCREGRNSEAVAELYHDDIISIEPEGAPMPRAEGLEAVKQKDAHFFSQVEEVHGASCSDPIVMDDHFSVSMGMDLTMKEMGRFQMNEIAVYKVKDGKIIMEQFFFTPMMP
jgi:ketosteroid isomerase-like protein